MGCEPVGGVTKGFVTGIGSSVLHLGCVSLGPMKDRVAPAATFVLMLRRHMLTSAGVRCLRAVQPVLSVSGSPSEREQLEGRTTGQFRVIR